APTGTSRRWSCSSRPLTSGQERSASRSDSETESMADLDLEGSAVQPRQGADQRPRIIRRVGWMGGWLAGLALAMWLSQLGTVWLVLFALGSLAWTLAALHLPSRLALATAGVLWLTTGVAAGVHHRIGQVNQEWETLQLRVEERSAAALGQAL